MQTIELTTFKSWKYIFFCPTDFANVSS